jgi:hypothetical protein
MALWACVVVAVRGEDAWLKPERSAATPGATLYFEVTSANGFGNTAAPIGLDRDARFFGWLGDAELKVGAIATKDRTSRFPVTFLRPGVAVLGVELQSRVVEVAPEEVEAYLREVRAGDDLREEWQRMAPPRVWREKNVKFAKSFVRVGEPTAGDRTWTTALRFALEIVPEVDPTNVRVGSELAVKVLRNGEPVVGIVLSYVSFGETHEHVAITDLDGRARAKLDLRGPWLVRGTDLRRSKEPDRAWDSETTTMVVEVQ